MMKRVLPALTLGLGGLVTLIHCSSAAPSDDEPGGGIEGGTPSCTSRSSCTSSTSGGSGSNGGSSGQPGTSSSGSGGVASSSSGGERTYTRVPTKGDLPTASAGCGNANPPPRATQNWSFGDNSRYYLPYQPGDYTSAGIDEDHGYPVLVALHGCGGTAETLASEDFMHLQDYVGSEGIVVYAQANPNNGFCAWDLGGESDMSYLDAVIADVASKFCIDESRVFLFGFSYGGYMAQRYSCSRPGTIKALVSGASGYPDGGWGDFPNMDTRECGQIPTLIYGRDHDYDEPIGNSIHARDQRLAVNQCDGSNGSAYWPWNANRNDKPAEFEYAVGCSDYYNCVNGLRTTFCEDPKDLTDPDVGGDQSWNHTVWNPYRRPMWEWLRNLP